MTLSSRQAPQYFERQESSKYSGVKIEPGYLMLPRGTPVGNTTCSNGAGRTKSRVEHVRSLPNFLCPHEESNLTDSVHLLDILFALRTPKYLKRSCGALSIRTSPLSQTPEAKVTHAPSLFQLLLYPLGRNRTHITSSGSSRPIR